MELLQSHVKPLGEIGGYDAGEAVLEMFDDRVVKVFEWREDNYQGRVFVVYELGGMYFYAYAHFGSCSGCDDWIDAQPKHKTYFVETTLKEFVGVNCLKDIVLDRYTHPELRSKWDEFIGVDRHIKVDVGLAL